MRRCPPDDGPNAVHIGEVVRYRPTPYGQMLFYMPVMIRRSSVALLTIFILATCQPPATTSSPTPSATPSATAASQLLVDDRFGFVFWEGASGRTSHAIRAESNSRPLFDDLVDPGQVIASLTVSRDGRRLAYWSRPNPVRDVSATYELWTLDLAPGARPRVVLRLPSGEEGGDLVWSSDGAQLVMSVIGPYTMEGADAPPEYAALRLVDVTTGNAREIARNVETSWFVPLAWDRTSHVIAAYENQAGSPGPSAYDLIGEDGARQHTRFDGSGGYIAATADAGYVLGQNTDALRVWALADPSHPMQLGRPDTLVPAQWRPGTTEIGLLFSDRFELWSIAGTRRSIPLPHILNAQPLGFFFRADGNAVVIAAYGARESDGVYAPRHYVVELGSGQSMIIPGEDVLSASVRLPQ